MKMKVLFTALLLSPMAFSSPTQMRLLRPDTVTVKNGRLSVSVLLPCKNRTALDWSTIVRSADDTGDLVTVVGLVVSESQCEKSADGQLNRYTTDEAIGYKPQKEEIFTQMELAK